MWYCAAPQTRLACLHRRYPKGELGAEMNALLITAGYFWCYLPQTLFAWSLTLASQGDGETFFLCKRLSWRLTWCSDVNDKTDSSPGFICGKNAERKCFWPVEHKIRCLNGMLLRSTSVLNLHKLRSMLRGISMDLEINFSCVNRKLLWVGMDNCALNISDWRFVLQHLESTSTECAHRCA